MFDASELITQREVVSQRVNELLQERAESFHLLLDDISIVRLHSLLASVQVDYGPHTFCVYFIVSHEHFPSFSVTAINYRPT